jgi:archaeal type IV pilus assembly protein PilA
MKQTQDAVSPVVAVMLMLVVTIIIAAVVSAFAGNTLSGATKSPSAAIQAKFSQSGGMQIVHAGGDSVPASNLYFTMIAGETFGQGISAVTTEVLNRSILTDVNGNRLFNYDGTSNISSFSPGNIIYVPRDSLRCDILQPGSTPSGGPTGGGCLDWNGAAWTYTGSKKGMWATAYTNPANIGKTFTLVVADKSTGATIAKTPVVIEP